MFVHKSKRYSVHTDADYNETHTKSLQADARIDSHVEQISQGVTKHDQRCCQYRRRLHHRKVLLIDSGQGKRTNARLQVLQ